MLGTLLFMTMSSIGMAEPTAEVAATSGPATIHRGRVVSPAQPRAQLETGDRLETGAGGGISLILPGGDALDLGAESSAILNDRGEPGSVAIARGETRVVVDGTPITIGSIAGKATLNRGIFRVSISPNGMRLWAEAGTAQVVTSTGRSVTLRSEQELLVTAAGVAGEPIAASRDGWAFRPASFRLGSAAQSSRRAKDRLVGQANDELAQNFLPSGQTSQTPSTSPTRTPPTTTDEAGRPAPNAMPAEAQPPATASETEDSASTSVTQPAATSAISLALGSSSASLGVGSSGAAFSDAQQDSLTNATIPYQGAQLPLAGNIHLITAQDRYTLGDVHLRPGDLFPIQREYWSIGRGASPITQVVTTFRTGSDPVPQTLRIPRFDAYLVRFPQSNYGIQDPANPKRGDVTGISGLVGAVPVAPQVRGATPLLDSRAVFNNRATFALGEFALQRSSTNKPQIDIRRSDQDRQIIKSPDGNDNKDKVTLNPQVQFVTVRDAKFFPELPKVSRPALVNPVSGKPSYASLDPIQRAGATTLLADKLSDYSQRTGRTRFVLGGRVVDISGYRPASQLRDPLRQLGVRSVGAAEFHRPAVPGPLR